MFLTILIIIFGFSFLIIAHELGHFFAAKWTGMKVEEFGLGFPPRVLSRQSKKTGTVYSINWIPFGAFVRIKGEDEIVLKGNSPAPDSFKSKPVWKRIIVAASGVLMNVLAAAVILSFLSAIGLPSIVDDANERVKNPQVRVLAVSKDSPAEAAGLQEGDILLTIMESGKLFNIDKVSQTQDIINGSKGREISIVVIREGKEKEIKTTPRENPPGGEGPLGISLARVALEQSPWHKAPIEGAKLAYGSVKIMLVFLKDMFIKLFAKGQIPADVVGPVGIIAMSGEIARMGIVYVFWILALISLNLFLINLLPFPALDGGRLVFLIIEGIKGSPVSQKLEQKFHLAGFAVLILLMILITARDIIRLF